MGRLFLVMLFCLRILRAPRDLHIEVTDYTESSDSASGGLLVQKDGIHRRPPQAPSATYHILTSHLCKLGVGEVRSSWVGVA
jgi:hypothetical protein